MNWYLFTNVVLMSVSVLAVTFWVAGWKNSQPRKK